MLSALLLSALQVSATAPQPVASKQRDEKVTCERAPITGSRLKGSRLCFTKAEFDAYKRSLRVMLDQKQRIGYFEEASGGVCTPKVDRNC